MRATAVVAAAECASLDAVRAQIDRIDRSLVRLLAERATYVARAADFKRSDAEVRAPERAAEVVRNAGRLAAEAGADARLVERIYGAMVAAFTDYEMFARKS